MSDLKDKNDIYELGSMVGNELVDAAEKVAKESLKHIAQIISQALNTIREFDAEAIGEDILLELETIKETGMPIAADFMESIQGHLSSILSELNDENAQKLQQSIGRLATLGLKGFMELWDHLQEVFAVAIEEGRELVQESLPALNAAVGTLVDIGEDVIEQISSMYNSEAVQGIIGDGFEEIDDALTQSRDAIQMAMNVLAGFTAGGCATFCPLIRFEIFRDFWQIVSLFFTNLYQGIIDAPLIQRSKDIFGGIGNFIAIDVAAALQSDSAVEIGLIVLLVVAIAMYIAYLWFIFSAQHMHNTENEIREGHEAKKWADVAVESSKQVKVSTYILTACLSVYLPLTRTAIEVIFSEPNSFIVRHYSVIDYETNKVVSEKNELATLRVAGFIILLTFTVPLPFMLARIVSKNKPTGSLENPDVAYDVDGEEVTFDDDLYNRLVTQDPNQLKCPYRSLYKGFERKWAHYKIYGLVLKTLLAVVVVILAENNLTQSIVALVIYSAFAGLSFFATPFIDPLDDVMDASGRVTNLVTCAGGIAKALSTNFTLNQMVGLIIYMVNAVNVVIMGTMFLYGMEKSRLFLKNFRGSFTFSDTVLEIAANAAEKIIPSWDLERECKHRIWHTFWDNVLLNKCGEEVSLRLMELKEATAQSGLENIKYHWDGEADPQVSDLRIQCRRELEGVDVYWNDKSGTRDGNLDSKTCFGKMYINPYPFHCIIIYDDAKDESFIRHDKFQEFFQLNMSQEIKHRRIVRQKLRALSLWKGLIDFPFSRTETETVADGTKQVSYQDSEGNTKYRTEVNYSTVSFRCSYKKGVIFTGVNTNKIMSAGFNVAMTYNDGTGQATLPNTGKVQYFQNRYVAMGHSHLGLRDSMEESTELRQIFKKSQGALNTHLPLLLQQHHDYRIKLIKSFEEANSILGNGFWYYVYNNPHLSRDRLQHYLANDEGNPILKSLVTKDNTAALNFVYKRMNYVRLHPAMKLWYTFWDDFYYQNQDMTVIQPCINDFNPLIGHSICYRLMRRVALEKWLGERGLIGTRPSMTSCIKCAPYLFHEGILDPLYQRLAQLEHPGNVIMKV